MNKAFIFIPVIGLLLIALTLSTCTGSKPAAGVFSVLAACDVGEGVQFTIHEGKWNTYMEATCSYTQTAEFKKHWENRITTPE